MSDDGRSATMIFTGGGKGFNNDSFNTVRIKFVIPEKEVIFQKKK